MKKYLMLILFTGFFKTGFSQTLQTVTDNGNITTNGITIGTGHTGAKFNVNAYGMDANGSNDVSMIVANQRYNSTNSAGENRIVLGWANHWAAAIGAYKESTNISGLRFYTEYGFNTPQEKMRITGAGNVGIGTTNPTERLSVKGKIRAQEVKVELANWPDYVFAKDYALPTLAETERHIKEKGHLPGIPSAAEVKENGVELGDMNKKLLQKIEELTLHLIEMKKENAKLGSLLTEQQTAIKELQLKIK
ncbi:hypothetical protein [Pedobacter sp. JY14-1]|uniref:hypothetical protein n=1 Tax=Pedobacter sp. JY14-1 TaxID=3034151 RepID=UPI0023E1DA09|nr:hypothetical protein [Pedobacter sp. JY14-1]